MRDGAGGAADCGAPDDEDEGGHPGSVLKVGTPAAWRTASATVGAPAAAAWMEAATTVAAVETSSARCWLGEAGKGVSVGARGDGRSISMTMWI